LNVVFDNSAIKSLNEICKCDPVDGVSVMGDEVAEEKSTSKYVSMG